MTTRDYSADFNEALAAFIPEGGYVSSVLAAAFCDHLRTTDADLLNGWLVDNAAIFVCDRLGQLQRHSRSVAAGQKGPREFGQAAEQLAESADVELFATKFCLGAKTWKPLGQMTGADHLLVAQSYDASARVSAMLAAFHNAVARKVGKRTTAEVLTEDAYHTLRDSILKPARTSAA